MADARAELASAAGVELRRAAPPQADFVCKEIRRRHGATVAAVLFYGSCLRKQRPDEGVLDFYALVDDYDDAYSSRLLARSNAWLAPNVFYLELASATGVIRTKYAVISVADFERGCQPSSIHAIVWARFCQPSLLVWSRSPAIAARVAELAAQATMTMVLRSAALVSNRDGVARLTAEELWQRGFEETYSTELRTERRETIQAIYRAAPDRYDRFMDLALSALEDEGLDVEHDAGRFRITMSPALRRRLVVGWRLRRPIAKSLYALRLVKSALTFGDWLPYAIWKLNRHTGVHIEPTASQRRHPLIFGWPLILRLLWQQKLR